MDHYTSWSNDYKENTWVPEGDIPAPGKVQEFYQNHPRAPQWIQNSTLQIIRFKNPSTLGMQHIKGGGDVRGQPLPIFLELRSLTWVSTIQTLTPDGSNIQNFRFWIGPNPDLRMVVEDRKIVCSLNVEHCIISCSVYYRLTNDRIFRHFSLEIPIIKWDPLASCSLLYLFLEISIISLCDIHQLFGLLLQPVLMYHISGQWLGGITRHWGIRDWNLNIFIFFSEIKLGTKLL